MAGGHFGPGLFAFFRELKANNTREWFADNKDRFRREVETPMLQFIDDLSARLRRISPAVVASPKRMGGSMFRIYRDTRFSADKSPFKTAVAARFLHGGKAGGPHSRPGFYIHLSPGNSVGGGGIYHPEMPVLRQIRQHIIDAPADWKKVLRHELEIQGDTLKRVPAGVSPDHPFAVDLRRKDHYVMETYTAKQVTGPEFLDRYTETCERVAPLVAFLSHSLGLRW